MCAVEPPFDFGSRAAHSGADVLAPQAPAPALPTHGVIGSHRARHPHTKNFLQALGTLQGPVGMARRRGWHRKALLPEGPEGQLEEAVGLLQSGDLLETHFC